jgi:UMF1 family MFS transporter
MQEQARSSRAGLAAWCLFDWGRHAFPTVVLTFVFSVYFTRAVAGSEIAGTALWTRAIAVAGLVSAVLSPLVGAVADQTGRRKPWLGLASALCVAATAALWWVRPHADDLLLPLLAVVIASVARSRCSSTTPCCRRSARSA